MQKKAKRIELSAITARQINEFALGVGISAFVYAVIFFLNDLLTVHLEYGLGVSWIYLPAGLRLFLILIFGFSGALGIALASFAISYFGAFSPDLTTCIGVGVISGFAPYLAKWAVVSNITINRDLSDLSMQKILWCIGVYALMSAGLHQWWFVLRGLDSGSLNHFFVMLVGDIAGSLLLIAAIKYGIDFFKKSAMTH